MADELTPKKPSEDSQIGRLHDAVLQFVPVPFRTLFDLAWAFALAGWALYAAVRAVQ